MAASTSALTTQLRRTRDLLADLGGRPVAWGRDWERGATPNRVVRSVLATLEPGGTVLLHDSDRTSAPGSWRVTLAATDRLIPLLRERSLEIGLLARHGLLVDGR